MLQYGNQQVSTFVCLSFGASQVWGTGCLKLGETTPDHEISEPNGDHVCDTYKWSQFLSFFCVISCLKRAQCECILHGI